MGYDLAEDKGQKTKDRGWGDEGQRTARKPSFVLCLLSSVLSHWSGTPVVQVAPWGTVVGARGPARGCCGA